MTLRLLAKPLIAFSLWSLVSCSKKDEPVPTTGTYTLSGVVTPCQIAASTRSGNADYLDLRFTPTDSLRRESVLVSFVKSTGTPASDYKLSMISYAWNNGYGPLAINYFTPDASATLTQLSSGGYSGTFSATFSRFTAKVITAGAFTNVRL
jgi:hypothetical protein